MARVHSLDITLEVGEDLDVKGKSLQWAPPCGSVLHQGIVVQVLTQSCMKGLGLGCVSFASMYKMFILSVPTLKQDRREVDVRRV